MGAAYICQLQEMLTAPLMHIHIPSTLPYLQAPQSAICTGMLGACLLDPTRPYSTAIVQAAMMCSVRLAFRTKQFALHEQAARLTWCMPGANTTDVH